MNILESEMENIDAWASQHISVFLEEKGVAPEDQTTEMKVLAKAVLLEKGKLDVLQSGMDDLFGKIWQQELAIQRNPNIEDLRAGLRQLQDSEDEMKELKNQVDKKLELAYSKLKAVLNRRMGGKRKQTKKSKKSKKRKTRRV